MSLVAQFERATGVPPWRRSVVTLTLISVVYLAFGFVVAFLVLPRVLELSGGPLVAAQVGVILAGAAVAGWVSFALYSALSANTRLWAMTHALGWDYIPDVSDRPWGGSIDEQVERRGRSTLQYLDARHTEVPFDTAVRLFTVGDGPGAAMYTTRAVRIPLPSEAPRITVRSRSGAGALSVLPERARRSHRLTLEGGFSDVFEVWVPSGYERDALYVLTPDLMALLLDNAEGLDMEIVDATLHVYLPDPDLSTPERLDRFLAVVWILWERFGRRTFLYRDEAAPELDPASYRRAGDTLSEAARRVPTTRRLGPMLLCILVPFVPLGIGLAWTHLAG